MSARPCRSQRCCSQQTWGLGTFLKRLALAWSKPPVDHFHFWPRAWLSGPFPFQAYSLCFRGWSAWPHSAFCPSSVWVHAPQQTLLSLSLRSHRLSHAGLQRWSQFIDSYLIPFSGIWGTSSPSLLSSQQKSLLLTLWESSHLIRARGRRIITCWMKE